MNQSGGNERVVVDPITRIEGHLRIEAQMNGSRIDTAATPPRPGSIPKTMPTIMPPNTP